MVAGAELVAADGTRYDGYVYPAFEFQLGFIQPTIVTDAGQVAFWFGAFPPKPGVLEEGYALLGKTADDLFPVSFRAVVGHEGATLEGQVPAFLHYKALGSGEVVEVR